MKKDQATSGTPGLLTRRGFLALAGGCALCAVGGAVTVDALESAAGAKGALRERHGAPSSRVPLTLTSAERRAVQPDALFRVDIDEPVVGLSFDDGPDPMYTPAVLDILSRYEMTATFFLIGVNAVAYPDLVARQVDAGHGVGNHTYDHADLEHLDSLAVTREIDGGASSIVAAGGPRTTLFRPPKGLTDEIVDVTADRDRYRTVFWDVCLERFIDHTTVRQGTVDVLDRARPGSIILMHDGGHVRAPNRPSLDRSRSVEALPMLLEGLRHRGYRGVDVATLVDLGRRHRRRDAQS
jgi:peptidoglycan/xylan/chitin deacetylase (PgdA/CDA1 family)